MLCAESMRRVFLYTSAVVVNEEKLIFVRISLRFFDVGCTSLDFGEFVSSRMKDKIMNTMKSSMKCCNSRRRRRQ